MPYSPPPELASLSLSEIAELVQAQKLPPVEKWEPEETGDSEMQINADGSWLHQGSPINRPAMVRAFSTLLRREPDGSFVLAADGEEPVFGEAYLVADGKITLFCTEGETRRFL